jgi:hypothetical protein
MDERIKKILTEQLSKNDVNLDSQMLLQINNTSRPLPLNNLRKVLNLPEQEDLERQTSTKYRFYGNIKPVISNANYNKNIKIYNTGTTNNPQPAIQTVTSQDIIIENGWFGYYDDDSDTAQTFETSTDLFNDNKSSLCQFIPFDPGYDRLNFIDSDGVSNYILKITYPAYTEDITLVENGGNGVSLSQGIPVTSITGITINDRKYTLFESAIKHGLQENDIIQLYGFTDNTGGNLGLDSRKVNVFKLGDETNENKDGVFVLDINPNEISLNLGSSYFTRWVDDKESKYYVRVFSALTTDEIEYDIYPTAYEKTYYGDQVVSYNFKDDIDVNGLRDNLGRPLSEVFLTIIKKKQDADPTSLNDIYWDSQQTTSTEFWSDKVGGFITSNETINYNIRAVNDPNYNQIYYTTGVTENDSKYVGDIVEYNENELYEKVLEDVYHRLNTVYREENGLYEGYIYKPHNRIKIRDYSGYIEYGDPAKVANIPDYATIEYSGVTSASTIVYKWRDLLDIGVFDEQGFGVDYPFVSGAHYLYVNSRYYYRRQDPPCNLEFIDSESTIDEDNLDNFVEKITTPLFMGIVSIGTNNNNDDLLMITRGALYSGDYNLGLRYNGGGCIDLDEIKTKVISNVC